MAYGNGKERQNWLKRAVPLGVGELTTTKRDALMQLRDAILSLMREMAAAGFSPEPLKSALTDTELDEVLLAIQKRDNTLNSVWREQARMRVKPALRETVRRYFSRLAGGLRYLDQEIPARERKEGDQRRYYHIPETVQDSITPEEIRELQTLAEKGQALEVFRQWIEGQHDFSPGQVAVLEYLHERAQRKHNPPDFGARDDFVLQIPIDARMVPRNETPPALALRDGAAFLLNDEDNRRYYRFLDIAGLRPRAPRIRIPLVLAKSIAKRIKAADEKWAALLLELGARSVGVRLVAGHPPDATDRQCEVQCFLGRDFGYVNTITLSLVRSPTPVDVEAVQTRYETLKDEDEAAVRAFLETHAVPSDIELIAQRRFSGRPFLNRINEHSKHIEGLTSRIDIAYNELKVIADRIRQDLKLAPDERITPEMKGRHQEVRSFFAKLGLINDLKRARRARYRKIAAIKKCWFGYLSNIEVELAEENNAAVVRENLTVTAIEKDAPEYKGRVFNRMINHGSKGQYQRRASAKFSWNGVPEIEVPSWYSSRYCAKHSRVVEKRQRKGEQIRFPCCGRRFHADEHAATTIACYPFLRPVS